MQHVWFFEISIFEHFWTWMFWEDQFSTVLEFDLMRTSIFSVIRFRFGEIIIFEDCLIWIFSEHQISTFVHVGLVRASFVFAGKFWFFFVFFLLNYCFFFPSSSICLCASIKFFLQSDFDVSSSSSLNLCLYDFVKRIKFQHLGTLICQNHIVFVHSIKMLLEWPITWLLMPFCSKLTGNLERRHAMLPHGFTNNAHWGWGVINAILRTATSTRRAFLFFFSSLSQPLQVENLQKLQNCPGGWSWPCSLRQLGEKAPSPPRARVGSPFHGRYVSW